VLVTAYSAKSRSPARRHSPESYRLRQIERLTGRDVRRFSDLLELVIGVRLLDQRR
jgi:hypothetical protein